MKISKHSKPANNNKENENFKKVGKLKRFLATGN